MTTLAQRRRLTATWLVDAEAEVANRLTGLRRLHATGTTYEMQQATARLTDLLDEIAEAKRQYRSMLRRAKWGTRTDDPPQHAHA